jgi:hypothetical protein
MLQQDERAWDIIVVADLLRIGSGWDDISTWLDTLDGMRIGLHSVLGGEIKPKRCASTLRKCRTRVLLATLLACWREEAYQ